MDFREYLHEVTGQIRAATVHEAIERELLTHLEDQKEAYLAEGMSEEAAEEAAAREMGDPVEVGLALDAVHKPASPGKYISIFLVFHITCFALNLAYVLLTWEESELLPAILSLLVVFGGSAAVVILMGCAQWPGVLEEPFRHAVAMYLIIKIILDIASLWIPVFLGTRWSANTCLCLGLILLLVFLSEMFSKRKSKVFLRSILLWGILLQVLMTGAMLWLFEGTETEAVLISLEYALACAVLVTVSVRRGWHGGGGRRWFLLIWLCPAALTGMLGFKILTEKLKFSVSSASIAHLPADSFLTDICGRYGILPAFVTSAVCAAFLLYLILLAKRATNEWSRMFFLTVSFLWGILILNSMLALYGVMSPEYVFAPFLWNALEESPYGGGLSENSAGIQLIVCYVIFGYIIRFQSRDSLLNLEIGVPSGAKKKTAEKA